MGHRDTENSPEGDQGREIADKGSSELSGAGHRSETSQQDFRPFVPETSNQEVVSTASHLRQSVHMPVRKSNRRVLVVDDERSIADTLSLIFKTRHYEAQAAYSAERAIEILAEWRPDLAIVDVILPEMNGINLAIVIKANYPNCHVLLFSGHANTALLLEEAGRKGHQFEVLAKPVHPNVMLDRASTLLGSREEPLYD
jgi:CheY-like chemotaxis protein